MGLEKRTNMIQSLETIMNWTLAVGEIKNNKSHNILGRRGRMYGMGYHASMEKKKSVVYYAPGGSQSAVHRYIVF